MELIYRNDAVFIAAALSRKNKVASKRMKMHRSAYQRLSLTVFMYICKSFNFFLVTISKVVIF